MSELHDLDLMQHTDRESGPGEPGEVATQIAGDARLTAKVAGLRELGDLVRGRLEQATDEVPEARFDALWREVDKGLDRAAEVAAAADSSVQLAVSLAAGPPRRGLWQRFSHWLERFRGHVITGALSAGAVAALAIVLRPAEPAGTGMGSTSSGPIEVRPVGQRAPAVIESLDVPNGTGNVINVHDEDGNTAVIWVTPADIVEGT